MGKGERRYAEGTTVGASHTKYEIEMVLSDYGATHIGTFNCPDEAKIVFRFGNRNFLIPIPIPQVNDPEFTHTSGQGRKRDQRDTERAWQQEVDRRWRCLLITVKSSIELCKMGIFRFEEIFLAFTALPGGKTVGQALEGQIEQACETGQPLMLTSGGRSE